MNILNSYNKIQLIQTFILLSILIVWVNFFWLYLDLYKILTVFISVVVFDVLLSYIFIGSTSKIFNLSKVNISFWILFFLRTDILFIYILTSFVAVISKYIFTYKNKHFLNPSNFWVSLSLLLFSPYVYTNPLQWWFSVSQQTYILFFLFIIFLWLFIIQFFLQKNLKFNQIPLIISFILAHLFFYTVIWLNQWGTYSDFFNITFLIFALFMITDPKTTPYNYINKILFGILIALNYYILSYFTNENFNLLWSLFIATLFLPIIWKFENKWKHVYLPLTVILFIFLLLLCILFILYGHLNLQFNDRCISVFCK